MSFTFAEVSICLEVQLRVISLNIKSYEMKHSNPRTDEVGANLERAEVGDDNPLSSQEQCIVTISGNEQ